MFLDRSSCLKDRGNRTANTYDRSYIASALLVMPSDTFTSEQKLRYLNETPIDGYVRKANKDLFRRLRVDVGEISEDELSDNPHRSASEGSEEEEMIELR